MKVKCLRKLFDENSLLVVKPVEKKREVKSGLSFLGQSSKPWLTKVKLINVSLILKYIYLGCQSRKGCFLATRAQTSSKVRGRLARRGGQGEGGRGSGQEQGEEEQGQGGEESGKESCKNGGEREISTLLQILVSAT